jgi:hypothetical protein
MSDPETILDTLQNCAVALSSGTDRYAKATSHHARDRSGADGRTRRRWRGSCTPGITRDSANSCGHYCYQCPDRPDFWHGTRWRAAAGLRSNRRPERSSKRGCDAECTHDHSGEDHPCEGPSNRSAKSCRAAHGCRTSLVRAQASPLREKSVAEGRPLMRSVCALSLN